MNLEQIEARLTEIRTLLEGEGTGIDIDALKKEVDDLEARKKELKDMEERNALAAQLAAGAQPGKVIKPEGSTEKRYTLDSPEYRTAFLKDLMGVDLTEEERTAFVHTTGTTGGQSAGYTVPTTLLNRIWELIEEEHSILDDITIYRTGTILEVAKRVAIAAGDAGVVDEGDAPANDENNTFAKVTLAGKDFAKTLEISYALGTMSIDGFEQYLANEIAERLGSALAKDVIAQITSDYDDTTNAIDVATSGTVVWTDITKAFAVLKNAKNVVVYASRSTIYKDIVSMVDDNGRPLYQQNANEGVEGYLLGSPVKVEDAVDDDTIFIGDPRQIVGNMVQDILIESDRDIKKHRIIYSGYARFECALLAPKAFATLDVTP